MTRQIRKYTKEFKEGAITLALKSPSLTTTAKELGIPVGTLHTWLTDKKEKLLLLQPQIQKQIFHVY
jgi:transposase-like protein